MTRALQADRTIQWYPGHMVRAMRRLADDMKLIDVVIEVADARVPGSGTNPALDKIAQRKPRLLVLSREHLAEPETSERWIAWYAQRGRAAVAVDAKKGSGVARLRSGLERLSDGLKNARAIVLGIPNAGKSTVINALVGRNVARVEDRAGVTRAAQWFRVTPNLELMDTAGILVPKIDGAEAQWKMAVVGAVPRARFDAEEVIARFHAWYAAVHPKSRLPDLETFAQTRGFVRRGNIVDAHNAAWAYMKDMNDGKFGRMTFERPPAA